MAREAEPEHRRPGMDREAESEGLEAAGEAEAECSGLERIPADQPGIYFEALERRQREAGAFFKKTY